MVEAPSFRRDAFRRGGFTLLEVVIALAIFAIGAIAIIRIFPPALGVIQNSGDRLTAVNINRSFLSRGVREPGLVPYGVYDPNPGTNWRKDEQGNTFIGSVNGSPRRNSSIPSSSINDLETEYKESALGHFKNIVGEKHVVPSNGIVLTQFPFGTTTPVSGYLEDILDGATVSATGALDFTNAVSSATNTPYTSTVNDVVYASYEFLGNSRVQGIDEEPHTVVSTATPVQLLTAASVVAGPVTVRVRRPIPSASLTPQPTFGLVKVNTALAGKTISLDYVVSDWRWLVFDGVPDQNPEEALTTQKAVNLPIKFLDDTQAPFVYTLLSSQTVAPDMQAASSASALPSGSLSNVSRKTGQIVFNTTTIPATEKPIARVVYRTTDNWATQLSVAARYYKPYNPASTIEEWRDYALNGSFGSNDGYIYLKPNEAGKTLLVTYTYGPNGGTTAQDITLTRRVLTADNDIIDKPGTVPAAFSVSVPSASGVSLKVARLGLTDINGNQLTNSTPIMSIQHVEGVSVQSRTAWMDGNNFTQASSVGFRGVDN